MKSVDLHTSFVISQWIYYSLLNFRFGIVCAFLAANNSILVVFNSVWLVTFFIFIIIYLFKGIPYLTLIRSILDRRWAELLEWSVPSVFLLFKNINIFPSLSDQWNIVDCWHTLPHAHFYQSIHCNRFPLQKKENCEREDNYWCCLVHNSRFSPAMFTACSRFDHLIVRNTTKNGSVSDVWFCFDRSSMQWKFSPSENGKFFEELVNGSDYA